MFRKHKFLFIIVLALIVAIAAAAFFLRLHQTALQNAQVSIFNIPAPAGWKKIYPAVLPADQPADHQTIDFEKISTSTASDRIARAVEVTFDRYEGSFAAQFDGVGLNGAGLYESFASDRTWNVINGYLIFGRILPAQVFYTIVVPRGSENYVYTFSLDSARANLPGLSDNPVQPDDLKTLQAMVRNFAESLPSSTLK